MSIEDAEARVAESIEIPPVVRRIAEQIERGWRILSTPEAVAVVVVNSGEVREGLFALRTVEALRRFHVPRTWEDGQTVVCLPCNKAWPCPTVAILGVTE